MNTPLPPPPEGLNKAWYTKMQQKRVALEEWGALKKEAKILRSAVPWWPIGILAIFGLIPFVSSHQRLGDLLVFTAFGWLAASMSSRIRAELISRRADRNLAKAQDRFEPTDTVPGQSVKAS